MANEKISQLPAGAPAQTTDQVPIARSGANYSLNVSDILALFAGAVGFQFLASGTNTTATMSVGTGATLGPSGGGVVNANELGGVQIFGTPSAGYVLAATSPSAANWQATPGFSGPQANPGYIKFPTGLIIQWGQTAVPVTGTTFSFPTAFPNNCFIGVASDTSASGSGGFQVVSASQYILNVSHNSTYSWIAIGN